jgi:hypothetical protein
MSNKITVTWASISEKMDGTNFYNERKDKVLSMIQERKILGSVNNPIDSPSASITFTTLEDAQEWKTYIEALATKYNKSILSIVIE